MKKNHSEKIVLPLSPMEEQVPGPAFVKAYYDEEDYANKRAFWWQEFSSCEEARQYAFSNCPPSPGVVAVYSVLTGELVTEFFGYVQL